ncbi:MAG: magnesium transporter, partial [Porphyromonas sp.]|nr:magnesium transporter [Porphyromonas sp.]
LSDHNSVEISEIFDELSSQEIMLVMKVLDKDTVAKALTRLSRRKKAKLFNSLSESDLRDIIGRLRLDEKVDILEELPANLVTNLLKYTSNDARELINVFLNYPEKSAGALMTVEYVALRPEMTVREARSYIKEVGITRETIYTNYVIDESRKLIGIISLRELVTRDDDEIIGDIMTTNIVYTHTLEDQEEVAKEFVRYGFLALPVVDKENRMTGVITVDDVMDVVEQEATEDFQRIAAIQPHEEAYLDTPILKHVQQRTIWLLVLMVSATITGKIMGAYSNVLESSIILSIFIPMLMDTGGNSGAQSSTLVIRGLATGDIELKDWFKVFTKELAIAVIAGILLAVVNFFRILLFEDVGTTVAFVVSFTIVVVLILAKTVGGSLPFIAKAIGMDPAIMASPLITTIVDALALVVYFYMASIFLGI